MRVLQLGKFYPVRGGVEKVMYDLMLGLSVRNVHCDMLCAATEGRLPGTRKINASARLIVVETKIKVAATMIAPAMVWKLRQIATGYDIIHIHHPDPMACLALYCAGYRGKVVLHWHSDILKQRMMLKLYAPLQNWLIERANLIVGTTPVYVQSSTFLQRVQEKVDFIPIGVTPVLADPADVAVIRRRFAGQKLIFALGRLVEYKGYEYLIRAALDLDTSYRIVIGGKGPLEESLQALILSLGVQDRVELIGFISDEALPAWYSACDVFCLSSIAKTEAFAIVQIEAMSCGKPVISTHIPGSGVSWVNQDGVSGLVVECGNAPALALAIKRVMESSMQYERLAARSLERYQAFFTRSKMIDKCLEMYARL